MQSSSRSLAASSATSRNLSAAGRIWRVGLVLALWSAILPLAQLEAQTCDPDGNKVTGRVYVADGSTMVQVEQARATAL
jgi:hypothetical protein